MPSSLGPESAVATAPLLEAAKFVWLFPTNTAEIIGGARTQFAPGQDVPYEFVYSLSWETHWTMLDEGVVEGVVVGEVVGDEAPAYA